jgi:hypothetical protein
MANESVGQREEMNNKRSEAGSVEESDRVVHALGLGHGNDADGEQCYACALASMHGRQAARKGETLFTWKTGTRQHMQVKTPPESRIPIHDAFQAGVCSLESQTLKSQLVFVQHLTQPCLETKSDF